MSSTDLPPRGFANYTVDGFCRAHQISRALLYQLWADGRGPRRQKLGRTVRISKEAAAQWRQRMEEETLKEDAYPSQSG